MFFKVDLTKLDMYQKYEHKKPWFVNVSIFDPYIYLLLNFPKMLKVPHRRILK